MHNEKNLAEHILKLESLNEQGDPESLAAVYFAMYKQNLMNTRELEAMIAFRQTPQNQWDAAILALGDVLADQIQEEKIPDKATINYLKWNIRAVADIPTPLHSLFKVVNSEIVAGGIPDWKFIQSLLDHFQSFEEHTPPWRKKMQMKERLPKSFSAVLRGIKALCDACNGRDDITIPESVNNFLGKQKDKAVISEEPRLSPLSLPKEFEWPIIEEMLERESDDENESQSPDEKKNAFVSLARAYCQKIDNGDLSREDWKEAVFQTSIAPYAFLYGWPEDTQDGKEQLLRSWYRLADSKVAAVNVKLTHMFHEAEQKMTMAFEHFLYSSDGLQNPFLCKAFHEYETQDSQDSSENSRHTSQKNSRQPSPKSSRNSSEIFRNLNDATFDLSGKHFPTSDNSINILIDSDTPWSLRDDDVLQAHSVIANGDNVLMRRKPIINMDEMNNVTTFFGYTRKEDEVFHVFDPEGKIQLDYLHLSDLDKPWFPDVGDIPRFAESECIEVKGISDAILEKNGIKVPKYISFWKDKELSSPVAQTVLEECPDAHLIDDMSVDEITRLVGKFITTLDKDQSTQEIVVKPVKGDRGIGVKILADKNDGNFAKQVVEEILAIIKDGESVVLQERIRTPKLKNPEGISLDCSLRVSIVPNESGEPIACDSFARVGYAEQTINVLAKWKEILTEDWINDLRQQHPDLDKQEIDSLHDRILDIAKNTYKTLRQYVLENDSPAQGKDPLSLMGIDVMVDLRNGRLTPVVIEANGLLSAVRHVFCIFDSGHPNRSLFEQYEGGFRTTRVRAEELKRQVLRSRELRRITFHVKEAETVLKSSSVEAAFGIGDPHFDVDTIKLKMTHQSNIKNKIVGTLHSASHGAIKKAGLMPHSEPWDGNLLPHVVTKLNEIYGEGCWKIIKPKDNDSFGRLLGATQGIYFHALVGKQKIQKIQAVEIDRFLAHPVTSEHLGEIPDPTVHGKVNKEAKKKQAKLVKKNPKRP